MRVFKLIVNALVLFVFLPVSIVAVLGVMFAPLQPTARAVEPRAAFEASDIMWVDETAAARPALENAEPEPELESKPELETVADSQLDFACDPNSESAGEQGAMTAAVPEGGGVVSDAASASGDDLPLALPAGNSGFAENAGSSMPSARYSSDDLRVQGVIYDGGNRYTWYSQRVLPGDGLAIEGRHVSVEGYVVDAQDRIVVASSDLPRGTELEIPFGSGRAVVLDTGCSSGTIDIYTDF